MTEYVFVETLIARVSFVSIAALTSIIYIRLHFNTSVGKTTMRGLYQPKEYYYYMYVVDIAKVDILVHVFELNVTVIINFLLVTCLTGLEQQIKQALWLGANECAFFLRNLRARESKIC